MFKDRIDTTLTANNPVFNPYKAEDHDIFIDWCKRPIDALFTRLYDDREQLYQVITNILDEAHIWTGRHLKYGNLSIIQWTEFFLLHEAHHLFTIFKLQHGD